MAETQLTPAEERIIDRYVSVLDFLSRCAQAIDETLDRERARRGWSVTDLARASDLSIATASRVLAGRPLSMETLRRLGRAFRQHPPLPDIGALLDIEIVAEEAGDGMG